MNTTNQQHKVSFHFRDEWVDEKSGELIDVEYSTETVYRETQEDINSVLESVKRNFQTDHVSTHEGVVHTRSLTGCDEFKLRPRGVMSKEEMFDFIVDNRVDISVSNTLWQKTDGTKVRIKYDVRINDSQMCGMDLAEAIQYYYDNLKRE